jgi:hypothetical protein
MATPEIDRILEKLVRDVELAVHALYRGEVRQDTQKARTGHLLQDARLALGAAVGRPTTPLGVRAVTSTETPAAGTPAGPIPAPPSGQVRPTPTDRTMAIPVVAVPRPTVSTPMNVGVVPGWRTEDRDAVVKCINAWLPMGGPGSTAPDTKCIPAGKMLVPSWGERETAREAVRKISLG